MTAESLQLETEFGPTAAHVVGPTTARAPGASILIIHEWWGINQHMRDIADRFAQAGYLAVLPDLFHGKTATNAQDAAKLMNDLALADGVATIEATLASVKQKFGSAKFGITGFCMGGTFALRAACLLSGIAAAAPFYGDIPDESVLAELKAPVLFIAGLRDGWITPARVAALEEVTGRLGLPLSVVSYDADHAFFNNTRPEVFDADAARDAWKRVLQHFETNLV